MKKGNKKSETKKKTNKVVRIERVNTPKQTKIALGILLILIIVLGVILYKQSSPSYEGYWCSYKEQAQIVILLKSDYTTAQKEAIESKISTFENVNKTSFSSKEELADDLELSPNEIEAYDAIVISFTSLDAIGTYVEELNKMDGVQGTTQQDAKTSIELYNIQSWGKYTYTDSDEALEEDLIEGKYKEKKGAITFKPNDKDKESSVLYLKDGLLCADAGCKKVYFESDETCSSITSEEE